MSGGTELLLGGARSGKSDLAVRRARATGLPVTIVVTGAASDEEMAERIRRHRRERPPEWTTVEETLDLAAAVTEAPGGHCLVVDCLSLWVSNLLAAGHDEDTVRAAAEEAAAAAARRAGPTIAVTNEVGLGLVPMHPVGRMYRDALGRANTAWSLAADRAWLVVAGRLLPLTRPGDA